MMQISSSMPFQILPQAQRPHIPYLPDAPNSNSAQYDLNHVTSAEAAKIATDLYNDGKLSLHEMGLILHARLDINEDGSDRKSNPATQQTWDLIGHMEMAIESCRSRLDEQGVKTYQRILDVLTQTAAEPGRKLKTQA
ncbi:hypothetical protein [Deefgea sp. CFH1-16]|uniref:hypothetical protein n=1 Tax=Deefgea sp. CFH1-16 TaxID=2675457 RepID=UPI0015F39D15|nr:hypothetical protein [Deefgea sp. CFH1-16]MBM5573240.1 hypothetical protein [Deefgea sp. CFH1-16]